MLECSQGSAYPDTGTTGLTCVSDQKSAAHHRCSPRSYRGSSPANRRRGLIRTRKRPTLTRDPAWADHSPALAPVRVTWAIAPRPARLELEDDAYAGIPCWRGEQDWVETEVRRAYQDEYAHIRHNLLDKNGVGGVSLRAVLAVAREMARTADWDTGRDSRLTVETLCTRTGLGERTVQTARLALKLLGVGTEVLRGRQRTKNERLVSHKAGDRGRGWASVWALHPRKPVDKTRVRVGNTWEMAPHPRRGVFSAPSLSFGHNSPTQESVHKRPASRGTRVKGGASRRGSSPEALLLAARWLRDRRTPAWAAPHPVHRWAPALKVAAEHGFTADDLNDLIDDWSRRNGKAAQPNTPLAWMKALIAKSDLDFPPHVLKQAAQDQALRDAADRKERAQAARVEAARKRQEAVQALGGTGHRAALAVARTATQARTHRYK